jgi:hypothetical protein
MSNRSTTATGYGIVRTKAEIDSVLQAMAVQLDKSGGASRFRALTVEEGVTDFWNWLTKPEAENPYPSR